MDITFRRLLFSSVVWFSVALIVIGGTNFIMKESGKSSATQQSVVPTICGTVKGELASLWDPTTDGRGGFGDTPTLAGMPSLYYTAWSLRLASIANVNVLNLDKKAIAKAMISLTLGSNSVSDDARIPLVERINLTSMALQALHISVPESFFATLASLRIGNQYRLDRWAKSGNWPSTYLASQTLAAVGRPIPKAVLDGAHEALNVAKRANSPQTIVSVGVPVLGILSSTPGLLHKFAPDISSVLSSFTRVLINEGGVSAITAANLVSVAEIAKAAGVSQPIFPLNFLSPLLTQSGYYSVWQGGRNGNPQATYYAVRVGMPLASGARSVLAFGHVRQGWLSAKSRATVNSTFQAALAARACKLHFPQLVAFDDQILKWVHDAAMETKSVGKSLTPTQGTRGLRAFAAEACWLADAFGVAINKSLHTLLSDGINQFATQVLRNLSGTSAAGQVASAVELCHISLSSNIQKLLTAYLETANAATIEDALSLHIASRVFVAPSLDVRARSVALRLRTPTGLFRFKEGIVQPDLLSTSYGYAVSGGSEKDRLRAAKAFETPWGPGLSISGSGGNSPPVVDLASLAAGLSLLTADKSMPPLF